MAALDAVSQIRARYPGVTFLGLRSGEDLASIYSSSDVFVFPNSDDAAEQEAQVKLATLMMSP
jgi:glycosyltransferase involved in cell wall biosynthesis